ncbi:MAG: basic amino acid/polyamine antiporter [Clostridiales bacterium]|nr:basic amino acid/polyamine antiporter [Clostridiales bacterium]MDY6116878.1 basic amino acid/polyamine antiporter [Anaerovoracaceae bacterium]
MDNKERNLGVFPLAMFAVGLTLASGVFSLSGDFAKSGAHTLATLIGWAICGVGMFALTMAFFKLSVVKKNLTSGIYSYANEGFGNYVGFNSAWGYWMSAILAQISFIALLFETIGNFVPAFGNGANLLSIVVASVVIWALSLLVLRGVNQAVILNAIVVIAKAIPVIVVVIAIIVGGAFKWDVFVDNFSGTGELSLLEQVKGTVYTTVWIFIGIEGAVVISGRGKNTKISGQATIISFASLFILYVIISVLSMGVMPAKQLAELPNPSLGGVLETVVGPWGATLVNIGVIISLGGALFSYTILCVDSAFGPAEHEAFPAILARKNKNGAPTWSVIISGLIIQLFIIIMYLNNATFQALYALSTSAIMVPYVLSAFYYFKVVMNGEDKEFEGGKRFVPWLIAIGASVYGFWLLYASGTTYILIASLLYAPGTIMYIYNRHKRGKKIFDGIGSVIVCVVLVVAAIISLVLTANGTLAWF